MLDFQLAIVFQMEATLCDGMDRPRMVATFVEDSEEVLFSQPLIGQILVGDILIDHLPVDLHVSPPISGLLVSRILINKSLISQPLIMVVPPWHNSQTPKVSNMPTH
jgi:hypothetical protein